jgi:CheY-like chemotaxis protein
MIPAKDEATLSGRRVLVVEDEYFIAADLARALTRLGADVVGPVATREQALQLLATAERIDLAVLDINLKDEPVFPLADLLIGQSVPVLFATGYGEASIPDRYRQVPRWQKPFLPEALAQALPAIMRER